MNDSRSKNTTLLRGSGNRLLRDYSYPNLRVMGCYLDPEEPAARGGTRILMDPSLPRQESLVSKRFRPTEVGARV